MSKAKNNADIPKSNNPNKRKYVGLGLLFTSIFLIISIISHLFTWKTDQDKVSLNFFNYLFNDQIIAHNIFGKFGAYFSHIFVYQTTGISSILFPFVLLLISIKILLNIWVIKPSSFLKNSLFWLIWLSLALGYTFTNEYSWLGGVFGKYSSQMLVNWLGNVGFLSIIFFTLGTYLSFKYNFKWSFLVDILQSNQKNKVETQNIKEEIVEKNESISNIPAFDEIQLKEKPSKYTEVNILEKSIKNEDPLQDFVEQEEINVEKHQEESIMLDFQQESTPLELEVEIENSEINSKEESISALDSQEEKSFSADPYDPTLDLGSFKMPHLELLDNIGETEININRDELEENKNKIVKTLANYSIEIAKIKATVGPTVTLYEIVPAPGVRISKIKNLEDDIALSLSALGIRIIAPIPGRGTIGIEVPNQTPEIVGMKSILQSEKFVNAKMDLPIALGKTISNETFVTDLAKMPHLLMAGATGQGKSVGLNAVLVSLLYKKHPSQIKFVLVDPKKVELTLFNKLERHYLAKLPGTEEAIITDTKKVIHTLNSLCIEMDLRYELLKDAQVRNIKEYNTKFVARKLNPEQGHKFLPYIVLVIDEFADLIMTAGKEVETPIARLAQLARAIGIHLIIATQRPSVNIITGIIKANFPSRIAFRVTSKVDSRTILDAGGADQLIGKGDMLLSSGNDIIRIQCAFVDTPEVERITEYIGNQRGYPDAFLLPEYIDESSADEKEAFSMEERDALFDEAARIVVNHQQGSASLLQRKLKLGYNRAGRLVDQLEAAGIIGPFEGSKARQVLLPDENSLEQYLNNLK